MTAAEQPFHLVQPDDAPPSDPIGIWTRQARAHNTRRELVEALELADELAERRHHAYIAEIKRRIERAGFEDSLDIAIQRGQQVSTRPEPVPFPGHPAPAFGWLDAPAGTAGPDEVQDNVQPEGGDLDTRAAYLFQVQPDAGRGTVMDVLGVTEGVAKTLIKRHKPATR